MRGFGLLLAILFLVFLLAIFVLLYLSKKVRAVPVYEEVLTYTPASLGNRCVTERITIASSDPFVYQPQPCNQGMSCIKQSSSDAYGICRRSIGYSCKSIYECEPGTLKCDGFCTNSTTGTLHNPCNRSSKLNEHGYCNAGLTCSNSSKICLLSDRSTDCVRNSDCSSNRCEKLSDVVIPQTVNGVTLPDIVIPRGTVCKAVEPLGSACKVDEKEEQNRYPCGDPLEFQCSTGYCQPININTGAAHSICNIDTQPKCDSGLNCATNNSTVGKCVAKVAKLGEDCGPDIAYCNHPNICSLGKCSIPKDESGYFVKSYSCGANSSYGCIPGYQCSSQKECLGDSSGDNVCNLDTDCISGSCNKSSHIMRWIPDSNNFGSWISLFDLSQLEIPKFGASLSSYQNETKEIDRLLYLPKRGADTLYLLDIIASKSIRIRFDDDNVQIRGAKYICDGTIAIHFRRDGIDSIYRHLDKIVDDISLKLPVRAAYRSTVFGKEVTITNFDVFDVTPTVFGFSSNSTSYLYYDSISNLDGAALIANKRGMGRRGWNRYRPLMYLKFNSDSSFLYSFIGSTIINSIDMSIKYNSSPKFISEAILSNINPLDPTRSTQNVYSNLFNPNGGMYIYGFDVNWGSKYPTLKPYPKTSSETATVNDTQDTEDLDTEPLDTSTYRIADVPHGYTATNSLLSISKSTVVPPKDPLKSTVSIVTDPYFIPGVLDTDQYTKISTYHDQVTTDSVQNLDYYPLAYYPMAMGYDGSLFLIGRRCAQS